MHTVDVLSHFNLRDYFGTMLGIGSTWKEVMSSVILVGLIVLYVLYSASYFQVDVYFLKDRITYHDNLANIAVIEYNYYRLAIFVLFILWIYLNATSRIETVGFVILAVVLAGSYLLNSSLLSNIMVVVSLPIILAIILVKRLIHGKTSRNSDSLAFNYLVIIGTGLATMSVCISLLEERVSAFTGVTDLFLIFYTILAHFSPLIMFLCIFSVLVCLICIPIIQKRGIIKYLHLDNPSRAFSSQKYVYIFIIIIMLLSIILVTIPHLNPARQDYHTVSVDVVYYEGWIAQLQNSTDLSQFLSGLFIEISGGDRPLSLLLMLPFATLYHNDITSSLELIMPPILASSLVLVMFLFTRELTRNDGIALLSSFLTAISFQVLVGTYSGYYANWIGLIVMYFSFIFLVRYLRNPRNHFALFLFTALTVSLLFIHSYTWSIAVIFALIFVLVSYYKKIHNSRRIVFMVCLILLSLVVFDLAKSSMGIGTGALGRNLFTIERTGSGLDQVENRWSNLVRTVQVYVGGIYGNPIFLSVAFMGCILLFYNSKRRYTSQFVLIFFSLGILPLFFGDREILARIIYVMPFQIPASIAIFWIQRRGMLGLATSIILVLLILAWSIRIATNI
jgi:hypothetical protein